MGINLMIADDHPIVREGLRQLLELDEDFNVIGFCNSGEDTLSKVMDTDADVLLLDINFPDINGLEVLRKIKETGTNLKIIMLTIHNEPEYILKAVDYGCNGYVLKDADLDLISRGIHRVCDGEFFIQPSLAPILNTELIKRNKKRDELETLTSRELDVLKQIGSGMSNKEIAIALGISERTVKNHISNIFKKIQVADRTQAAVFAIKNDIVRI